MLKKKKWDTNPRKDMKEVSVLSPSERNPSEKNHILCDPNLRNSGRDTTLETVERLAVAVCPV